MFESSQNTVELDKVLAKVQGEMKPALKDSVNLHFASKYASLAAIWETARATLAKHGVSVTQWPISSDKGLTIVTRVAYNGEWMKGTFSIPVTKQDAQGYGSATTYARKFTLMAALGIAPDDDDDGNSASSTPPQQNRVTYQERGNTLPQQRGGL